jgi:uracil-DNA glycosylase
VIRTLGEAATEALGCVKCRLSQGRTQVVYGVGHPEADLMFIGEGPGYHEDKQGEPFVGAAGQLLTRLLSEIGLERRDVYICNVVKCLRYNSRVQLGDGSWERVGRLVRSRYDGDVMSVDSEGRLVRRRVIGWHASPLAGRRVFRLTYRSAKRVGGGRVSVELTGDHPVLTERGYVGVQALVPSDRIASGQGLSALARDVVCGTLLGDGHLDARSAHLSFSHSARQAEYALFKAELLAELSPNVDEMYVAAVAGGEKIYQTVHVRTLAHRALGILRRDFYRPKKEVPSWMGRQLNARMLAVWFMDDGYTRIRPRRNPIAEIATSGFQQVDLDVLIEGLAGLGLAAKPLRGRLFFDTSTTERLSEVIAPYVPSSMRYKLHPGVEARLPFDPHQLNPGPSEVLYDEVDVEDVTNRSRSDTTFFCIDVDGTHNFVTAGGVVHNCRPPGNRDPLPDEIEACRPWLMEQVALVDPAIVVTLGNFATRTILDRPVSISRVRGQRFIWEGRTVIPTFHPAAVLRGGGDASSQMIAIRSDFVELKAALAERPVAVEEQVSLF